MKRALLIPIVALMVAACGTAQPVNSGPRYQTFTYSCCAGGELSQAWHPGERRTVTWTAVPSGTSTSANGVPLVIRTRLNGPFATVADLKAAIANAGQNAATRTVEGTPLSVNNRTSDGVVTVISLPADLPAGFYDFNSLTDYGLTSVGGDAVIVVK